MTYAALYTKSNFSFLEGASHPDELVDQAHLHGLPALAVCDRDGLYGIVRAHVRAQELGQKLIVGAEVSVSQRAAPEEPAEVAVAVVVLGEEHERRRCGAL